MKSTYQEEFYTTPLDVNSIPLSQLAEADRIAGEIEAQQFGSLDPEKIGEGDVNADDEEARFGAVKGTGAYKFSTDVNVRSTSKSTASLTTAPIDDRRCYSGKRTNLQTAGFSSSQQALPTVYSHHQPENDGKISDEQKSISVAASLSPHLPPTTKSKCQTFSVSRSSKPIGAAVDVNAASDQAADKKLEVIKDENINSSRKLSTALQQSSVISPLQNRQQLRQAIPLKFSGGGDRSTSKVRF